MDDASDSTFYAIAALAIVGTLVGTYWLAGGEFNFSTGGEVPVTTAFVSKVAQSCEAGWKEGADNIDQMHCYLTNSVARLCNGQEKNALLDKVQAYDYDRLAPRRALEDRLQNGPFPTITSQSMQQATDRILHETKDQMAFESKTFEADQKLLFDSMEDWMKRDGRNQYPRSQLLKDTTALVVAGYLDEGDIDERLPKWAVDAITAAAKHRPAGQNSPCPVTNTN